MTIVKNIDVEQLYKKYAYYVKDLRSLGIYKDEIISDLSFAVLTCRQNYDPKIGSFWKYLDLSIKKNFSKKIYAIRKKFSTEKQINEYMTFKEKSPLSEALSKEPELINYILGEISDENLSKDGLDTVEDYV